MPNREELATMIGLAIHSGLRIHDSPLSGATMSAYNAIIGVDPGVWETICRDAADRVIAAGYMTREEALEMRQEAINEVASTLLDGDFEKLWQKEAIKAGWKSPIDCNQCIDEGALRTRQAIDKAVEEERKEVATYIREVMDEDRNVIELINDLENGKKPKSLKE